MISQQVKRIETSFHTWLVEHILMYPMGEDYIMFQLILLPIILPQEIVQIALIFQIISDSYFKI